MSLDNSTFILDELTAVSLQAQTNRPFLSFSTPICEKLEKPVAPKIVLH